MKYSFFEKNMRKMWFSEKNMRKNLPVRNIYGYLFTYNSNGFKNAQREPLLFLVLVSRVALEVLIRRDACQRERPACLYHTFRALQ